MESVQVRLTKEQVQALDRLVSVKLFSSRNEAVREAVRHLIAQYAQLAEFKWHIFGPRNQDDMNKIIKGSGDAEGIRVPKGVAAALENSYDFEGYCHANWGMLVGLPVQFLAFFMKHC